MLDVGLEAFKDIADNWHRGWILWDTINYITGFLIIALPAIIAANILPNRWRRIVAMVVTIVASLATWLQPGAKASVHKHAYICMNAAYFGSKNNVENLDQKYSECAHSVDYDYTSPLAGQKDKTAP